MELVSLVKAASKEGVQGLGTRSRSQQLNLGSTPGSGAISEGDIQGPR